MNTAVVILNWNGRHFLEKYLPAVLLHSQLPGVEIIIADNNSDDDSVPYLETNHPGVRIIRLDKNYGFAEGYNRSLQMLNADCYVLLNTDVEVTEGWLQPMIDMMNQKPDIAACMPKIRSAASRADFEYAGAAGGFMDIYGYTFCRGRLFHSVEKDRGQYDTATEIFWVTGACCMLRADLFHGAGGFDGDFFAHMEEIDLCWRLKNAGYSVWYTPHSVVYHVGGGMLPQTSPFKTFLNYRNNLLMMLKNLPARCRRRILYTRMVLDVLSSLHSLLKGDTSVIKAVCKAHLGYWKLHRRYRRMRRNLNGPFSYPAGVYRRSVVYQYFIRRCKTFANLPDNRMLHH